MTNEVVAPDTWRLDELLQVAEDFLGLLIAVAAWRQKTREDAFQRGWQVWCVMLGRSILALQNGSQHVIGRVTERRATSEQLIHQYTCDEQVRARVASLAVELCRAEIRQGGVQPAICPMRARIESAKPCQLHVTGARDEHVAR